MRRARTLMVQGTSSSAGKSMLVTALCRIFREDGFRVAPFKAQNMALNSFATKEGGEIGRAQAVQAEAAGVEPSVDMNPVLLKPEGEGFSQLVVQGRAVGRVSARDYPRHTPWLLEVVRESLERLLSSYDIVIIEGAGSPAEINLREREIANMRIAKLARSPVILVGDIDRGGVFASLVGTLELLDEEERGYIKGFVINKFRGDLELLRPGLEMLERRTGRPVLGVIPYFRGIRIAQEDSVWLDERGDEGSGGDLDIAVVRLPHISNYDDFDPLEEEGCRVRYVERPDEIGSPHLIILPGTKNTSGDLRWLWRTGFAEEISERARRGVPVIGICGGYQMLGRSVHDTGGLESHAGGSLFGLGLLDETTSFSPSKSVTQVKARVIADEGMLEGAKGLEITGYEIHMGRSTGRCPRAFHIFETPWGREDRLEGALGDRGLVLGTYIHGLFHNRELRCRILSFLRRRYGLPERKDVAWRRERYYDRLAEIVRSCLDLAAVYRIVEQGVS